MWQPFESGASIGTPGSEGGRIVTDEEYAGAARITLEGGTRIGAPFAITCGVYGWFVHTCYLPGEPEAQCALAAMKSALERIVALCDDATGGKPEASDRAALDAIARFVDRFPT